MRPWLALALVCIVGVTWLALRGSGRDVVAPAPAAVGTSLPSVASAGPLELAAELREVVDPGPADERAVAEGSLAPDSDSQGAALWVRALLPDGTPWAGGTLEIASEQPVVDLHESPRRPQP